RGLDPAREVVEANLCDQGSDVAVPDFLAAASPATAEIGEPGIDRIVVVEALRVRTADRRRAQPRAALERARAVVGRGLAVPVDPRLADVGGEVELGELGCPRSDRDQPGNDGSGLGDPWIGAQRLGQLLGGDHRSARPAGQTDPTVSITLVDPAVAVLIDAVDQRVEPLPPLVEGPDAAALLALAAT